MCLRFDVIAMLIYKNYTPSLEKGFAKNNFKPLIVNGNGGFEWNTSFNITFNKNTVLSLPEGDFADGSRFRVVGQPWNTWFIHSYANVDPQTGHAQCTRTRRRVS